MSWTFQNRWRIEVELQSSTPFHIGNGDILDEGRQADRESLERRRAPTLTDEQGRRRRVEVSTVVTDHRGRPYLPGTALKGAIRSWLLAHLTDPADRCRIEKVFGSEDTRRTDSVGGIAEFLDAFSVGSPPDQTHVPYADRERWTGIVASVAIDRRTRTAYEKKLYHEEYVPPGAKFQVVITGQNLDEEDVALILLALDQFPRKEPDPRRPFGFGGRPGGEASRALAEQVPEAIRLGAEGHDSSGLFARLGRPVVKRLLRKDVHAWLAEARNPSGSMAAYDGFDSVSRDVLLRLETCAAALAGRSRAPSRLVLDLELQFDGPFLVNEPYRAKPEDAPPSSTLPDHAPRLDPRGTVVLPSQSIRGAIRSRAERILRTLNPNAGGDPNRPKGGSEPIDKASQVDKLSFAEQVFGAPGWGALVEFSDFILVSPGSVRNPRQEFVAIDRFTGGGAPGLKFNAEYADSPRLQGTIGVDWSRWEGRPREPVLGLLALTLRDLVEGDITLGFAASKGYGRCHVSRLATRHPGPDPGVDFAELGPQAQRVATAMHQLNAVVNALRDMIKSASASEESHG